MKRHFCIFIALLFAAIAANAHPLGNFTINQYSRLEVEKSQIKVRQILDIAEIPAFQLKSEIDTDKNGEYSDAERAAVVKAFPRTPHFKEDIIQAFYDGIKHRPDTTFGNVKADVIADKEPHFHRGNFCSVIRNSHWRG